MRRYFLLVLALGIGWILAVGLLVSVPRIGLGWAQLDPGQGVIYARQFDQPPRQFRALVLQSQHHQRLFTPPPLRSFDCLSYAEDGRYRVVAHDQAGEVVVHDVWARAQIATFAVDGRASLCPNMVEGDDTVTFFGGNSQTERYQFRSGERFELPPLDIPPPPPREAVPLRDIAPYSVDPSERYLFYSRCLEDAPAATCDENWVYVVYDMMKDTVVAELPDADHWRLAFYGRMYFPAYWSPDSRYLLYPARPDPELEETEVRLYDMETDTTTRFDPPEVGVLTRANWSPNNRRVQLLIDKDVMSGTLFGDEALVAVVDVETGAWATAPTTYTVMEQPLWSPDGDALMFVIADVTGATEGILVHMDATTGKITTLDRNVTWLYGWFVTPPG